MSQTDPEIAANLRIVTQRLALADGTDESQLKPHLRGFLHHQRGELAKAIVYYDEAIKLNPQHFDAWQLKAAALMLLGQHTEAETCYRQAIALDETSPIPYLNLSVLYQQQLRYDLAIETLRRSLSFNPDHSQTMGQLGQLLVLHRYPDPQIAGLKAALLAKGDKQLSTLQFLGQEALEAKDFAAAKTHFEAAIVADPQNSINHSNLALVASELDEPELALAESLASLRLANHPTFSTLRNSAKVRHDRHEFHEAMQLLEKAEQLYPKHPDRADIEFFKAITYLIQGDFQNGFRLNEGRKQAKFFSKEDYYRWLSQSGVPEWRKGESIDNRHLLLFTELGYGDVIQMIRFLPWVFRLKPRKITLVLGPHYDGLARLFSALAPFLTIKQNLSYARSEGDCHQSLQSLPFMMGTDLGHLPPIWPSSLRPDPKLQAKWQNKLKQKIADSPHHLNGDLPLLGLNWRGNPDHRNDRRRSVALADMLTALNPLITSGKFRFILVQKDLTEEEQALLASPTYQSILDLGSEIKDFADSAAIINELNLFITIDSAPAHLAGGLGVPTWLLLPWNNDYRWLLDRTDSPWYPSMRLLRQRIKGDWSPVWQEINQRLTLSKAT